MSRRSREIQAAALRDSAVELRTHLVRTSMPQCHRGLLLAADYLEQTAATLAPHVPAGAE